MSGNRGTALWLVHNAANRSKELWDRRAPYPIEEGARRIPFSHLWNEGAVTPSELTALERELKGLHIAVERLLAAASRSLSD